MSLLQVQARSLPPSVITSRWSVLSLAFSHLPRWPSSYTTGTASHGSCSRWSPSTPRRSLFCSESQQLSSRLDLAAIAGLIAVLGTGIDQLVIITDEILHEGRVPSPNLYQKRLARAVGIIVASAADGRHRNDPPCGDGSLDTPRICDHHDPRCTDRSDRHQTCIWQDHHADSLQINNIKTFICFFHHNCSGTLNEQAGFNGFLCRVVRTMQDAGPYS